MGAVPYVTSCCCYVGLEVGARIIGVIHAICAVTLFSAGLYYAVELKPLSDDEVYAYWMRIAYVVTVNSVLHMFLAGCLLYGSFRRRLWCLRVWLCTMLVLAVVAVVVVLVTTAWSGFSGTGSHIFQAMLEGLIFFGFLVYCIICVLSYVMLLLRLEENQPKDKI